ncbi:uncharacterized protein LOC110444707 [Mizuhopecten yessoensis]|uniref:uncharacterized protein LOC110444707 n=1 Tax=Mizuhopecten yessoensis TaxID=6573 RepID=UPI000B45EC06|nr:uncharacterized protein LOC110444707 [Mizuhopecten yessoensis]
MAGMATQTYKEQKNSQTSCVHHKGEKLEWFCEKCSELICPKCVSSLHKGHKCDHLSEITPTNKLKIKAFIYDTEENELTQIHKELNSTQDSYQKDIDHLDSVAIEVEETGRKLKEDLDIFISQTHSQLKFLKDENYKLRHSYAAELEKTLGGLKEQLKQCKESLQTGTDIHVFDMVLGLQRTTTLPRKPTFGNAWFTPNRTNDGSLQHAFGKVKLIQPSWSDEPNSKGPDALQQKTSQTLPDILPRNSQEVQYPLPPQAITAPEQASLPETSPPPPYDRLSQISPLPPPYDDSPQTNILPELKSQLNISSVCPTNDGGAWTCYWKSDTVTHLTSQGTVQQSIQIPVVIKDISVSPTTQNIWACSDKDNSIIELTSNTMKCRFTIRDEPKTLCVIGEDHVIAGTKNKITEYTSEGKVVIATTKSLFSKPLVCSPQKISQCPISERIAIVDRDRSGERGQDKPHIVIMDKNLQVLYRYGRSQHKGRPGTKPFNPWDVAYDRMGHLVIADGGNCCLHLLSGSGDYLRLLHTDTALAWAVGVGRQDQGLWAVFGDRVKLVKYVHG